MLQAMMVVFVPFKLAWGLASLVAALAGMPRALELDRQRRADLEELCRLGRLHDARAQRVAREFAATRGK